MYSTYLNGIFPSNPVETIEPFVPMVYCIDEVPSLVYRRLFSSRRDNGADGEPGSPLVLAALVPYSAKVVARAYLRIIAHTVWLG